LLSEEEDNSLLKLRIMTVPLVMPREEGRKERRKEGREEGRE
jgi:hypothetical protein